MLSLTVIYDQGDLIRKLMSSLRNERSFSVLNAWSSDSETGWFHLYCQYLICSVSAVVLSSVCLQHTQLWMSGLCQRHTPVHSWALAEKSTRNLFCYGRRPCRPLPTWHSVCFLNSSWLFVSDPALQLPRWIIPWFSRVISSSTSFKPEELLPLNAAREPQRLWWKLPCLQDFVKGEKDSSQSYDIRSTAAS